MPTIAVNGLEIGYEVHGAGPPLIMLHGATSSGRVDFAAQIPVFARAFRCLLPDARGHASTRWDAADGFAAAWLVDDLAAFVDGLGLETFHLLGFSMGAMVALAFTARNPQRVRTLVVVGISVEREPRATVARRIMDPTRIDRNDPELAAALARRHDLVQGPDAWRRLLPAIAADVASQPLPSPRELHGIDAPTLVVCGDRDPFVPVDQAWGLRRQLPNARLLVVPDCGHDVLARQPAIVNEALGVFYRSTAPVARRRAGIAADDAGVDDAGVDDASVDDAGVDDIA
jgi:pimeloyl-ACP methyl ester carboxylesterase